VNIVFWHRHQHNWEEEGKWYGQTANYYGGQFVGNSDPVTVIYYYCKICGKRKKRQFDGWIK